LLAKGPAVAQALEAAVSDTTALTAAELVGVSAKALEITLNYIRTREQFGQPIGAFQVIQHRAVDMYVAQEVAEAGVRDVLALMDATGILHLRARQASRAKARACTAARKITREAIQLHGAVGYTDEFDIGLFLNRALVLSAWLGDAAYHRRLWLAARDFEEAAQ
jgi:alkylation response protein AidB-like acyl-CoA dehydrogenase